MWVRAKAQRIPAVRRAARQRALQDRARQHGLRVSWRRRGFPAPIRSNTGAQTRAGRSHVLLIGPSCASLDSAGPAHLVRRQRSRGDAPGEGRQDPHGAVAGGSGGKRFSGPNDIAVRSDDGVYLTDNDFGLRGARHAAR